MKLIALNCDWCGMEILRPPSKIKKHNFCSKSCLAHFSNKAENPRYKDLKSYAGQSAHMIELNARLNSNRMTPEVRAKLRTARLHSGKNKSYEKMYGRHTHRRVAEEILGRKLLPGEVVHHRDGDKRNNNPENLVVLENQAVHARLHALEKATNRGDGDELHP